jgi:hypothetical protein
MALDLRHFAAAVRGSKRGLANIGPIRPMHWPKTG